MSRYPRSQLNIQVISLNLLLGRHCILDMTYKKKKNIYIYIYIYISNFPSYLQFFIFSYIFLSCNLRVNSYFLKNCNTSFVATSDRKRNVNKTDINNSGWSHYYVWRITELMSHEFVKKSGMMMTSCVSVQLDFSSFTINIQNNKFQQRIICYMYPVILSQSF